MQRDDDKENRVELSAEAIGLFEQILTPEIDAKKTFQWQEIVAASVEITRVASKEAEGILVRLLDIERPIRLAQDSDIPGVMAPEDMLKSIAIRSLSQWTGRKYLKAFERVRARTESATLAGIVAAEMERLNADQNELEE